MIRFLLGMLAGVLLILLFIYFGGGKAVKRVGEGLTETGKRMEHLEQVIKKEKEEVWDDMKSGVKKKILKDEKEGPKKNQ